MTRERDHCIPADYKVQRTQDGCFQTPPMIVTKITVNPVQNGACACMTSRLILVKLQTDILLNLKHKQLSLLDNMLLSKQIKMCSQKDSKVSRWPFSMRRQTVNYLHSVNNHHRSTMLWNATNEAVRIS